MKPYLYVDWSFSLGRVKIFFLGLQIYITAQTFSRCFCLEDATQGYFPAIFILAKVFAANIAVFQGWHIHMPYLVEPCLRFVVLRELMKTKDCDRPTRTPLVTCNSNAF